MVRLLQAPSHDLTYDDVFLVPRRSAVSSRLEVDLRPRDGTGTHVPVVAANMTSVTGRRMAETLARRGALAVLPQEIPTDQLTDAIAEVKSRHPVLETPVTATSSTSLGDVVARIARRAHGVAVVVDDADRVVGVVTPADAADVDPTRPVESVLGDDVTTLPHDLDPRAAFERLAATHRTRAPAVDRDGRLAGLWTRVGALRSTITPPSLDARGRLRVAAAVGISGDAAATAAALLDAGVDALVVDTAHGHQERMLAVLKELRELDPDVPVVAGNVVTAQGAEDLVTAGADVVKVGVGPGAMCTTRMVTGVGRPQLSAVLETAAAAASLGATVWADGGVRHPRDVALALAAGAANVMIGSWLAGTHESPGQLRLDAAGRPYKVSFGMASARAVRERNVDEDAFTRARRELFQEGISSGIRHLDPERPGVEDVLDAITAGVRSACTYSGAADLAQLHERAVLGLQTGAGYAEGRPHPNGA